MEGSDRLSPPRRFLHDQMLPPLIHAALAHYQFEAIHPFLDGNGRVGRLLITIELCERNVLPAPFLYLSAFFDATREDYYGGLRGISERGDRAGWLQYFLNGARQSEDALSRAERTNALLERRRRKLATDAHAKVAFQMVDLLGANPFVTPRGTQQRFGLAYNTVMRAIGQLEKQGIVKEVSGAKRDRVYCAKKLLQIFEEPPQLKPARKF
jgi:Fic family protein